MTKPMPAVFFGHDNPMVLEPISQAAGGKTAGRVVAHYAKMETREAGHVPGHVPLSGWSR